MKDIKLQFGHLINETTKTTKLGLFSFRAFLNIGMLLTDSEKARQVRAATLAAATECDRLTVQGAPTDKMQVLYDSLVWLQMKAEEGAAV